MPTDCLVIALIGLIALLLGVIKMGHHNHQSEEEHLLRLILENQLVLNTTVERQEHKINILEREVHKLIGLLQPRLARVAITLGDSPMADPIVLSVGDTRTATVQGFDQFGNSFPIDFTASPAQWASSDSNVVSSTPSADTSSDALAAVAAGVADVTVSVAGFSDSLNVTVSGGGGTPVLSSVKIVVS